MSAEFSRRIPLAKLSTRAQPFRLEADAETRSALAKRFDLVSIDRLEADLEAARSGGAAIVTGRLIADVVQSCVVSGEPVPAKVDEALDLRFEEAPSEDDLELEEGALDVLHIEDDAIDLGEAVAQSLFLALEPYPRADAATLERVRLHLLSEEEAEATAAAQKMASSPFAKLKRP